MLNLQTHFSSLTVFVHKPQKHMSSSHKPQFALLRAGLHNSRGPIYHLTLMSRVQIEINWICAVSYQFVLLHILKQAEEWLKTGRNVVLAERVPSFARYSECSEQEHVGSWEVVGVITLMPSYTLHHALGYMDHADTTQGTSGKQQSEMCKREWEFCL